MLKPFPLGSCTFLLSLALINFNLIGFSSGSSRLNKNNLPESQEVSLSSYSHVNNRVTGLESMDNVLADDESNACENAVAETIFRVIAVLGGMRYVQRPVTLIQQGSSCTSFDQEPL